MIIYCAGHPRIELWEQFQQHLMLSTFPSDYEIIFDFRQLTNLHWSTDTIADVLHKVGKERCPLNLSIKYLYSPSEKENVIFNEQRLIATIDEIRIISTRKLYGAIFAALDLNMSIHLIQFIVEYLTAPPRHSSGLSTNTLVTQTIEQQMAINEKKGFALFGFFPSEAQPKPYNEQLVALLTHNLKTQFEGIEKVWIGLDLIIFFKNCETTKTFNNIVKATNIKTVLSDHSNSLTISGKNIQKFMDAYGKMDATLLFQRESMRSGCSIS